MVKKVVKTETITTESVEESQTPGEKVRKHEITTTEEEKPKSSGEKKKKKRKYTKRKTSSTKKKRKKRKNNSTKTNKTKRMTAREREEMLIENFVGLQHAMTNLSIKFGSLSDNISNLLMVFEEAAKNFAGGGGGMKDNKDLLKKINSLLEQNKTIARGLVLMEGKLRGRAANETPQQNFADMTPSMGEPPKPPKPLPSI